jgi:hypothetical protein
MLIFYLQESALIIWLHLKSVKVQWLMSDGEVIFKGFGI